MLTIEQIYKCEECGGPNKPDSNRCEYCGYWFIKKEIEFDPLELNPEKLQQEFSYHLSEIRKVFNTANNTKDFITGFIFIMMIGLLITVLVGMI